MKYTDARKQMIQTWGQLSAQWGINRTMGQIHALLMISPKPMTSDQIMAELNVSRGNVSMSLRSLVEWGLVYKEYMPGDRKEYYSSEKDAWKIQPEDIGQIVSDLIKMPARTLPSKVEVRPAMPPK